MPKAKKTNFVANEIANYEKYINQIQEYLDTNPANKIKVDRIDTKYNERTGQPVSKTIASKEQQLAAFISATEKLPKLVEALNNLRQIANANGEDQVDQARGNKALPGFIKHKMLNNSTTEKEEAEDEYIEETAIKTDDDVEEIEAEEVETNWEEDDD